MIKNCPVCSEKLFENIFSSNKISEYNLNYQNNFHDALNYKSVKVNFVECIKCGFLFNKIYKQLSYNVFYDANRNFSKKFDDYLNEVVRFLKTNIFEKNKINNILEIGFGDAVFLNKISILKKYKFKNILGFDPSNNSKNNDHQKSLKLKRRYYTEKDIVKPDLVILRHTLEHISNVKNFMYLILHEKPKFLFIEVPCKSFVYNNNIHYYSNEHCSYFDNHSLQVLLKEQGYKKVILKKVFKGENLLAIFIKKDDKIKLFNASNVIKPKHNFLDYKKNIFKNFNLKYDFLWGAAGKGVILLNILNIDYKKIRFIVDVNKNIQGKFTCLTGVEIISPDSLPKYIHKNSKIFIMNKIYESEIKEIIFKLNLKNKVFPLFTD